MIYFWFRRDLRLNDNVGLNAALKSGKEVQPIFIFDKKILNELPEDDARVSFIHKHLEKINSELKKFESSVRIEIGNPIEVWKRILEEGEAEGLYFNHDYEPYAMDRDNEVTQLFRAKNLNVQSFKDHVFFEKNEVVKDDGNPYTVFTPYKRKWLHRYEQLDNSPEPNEEELRKNFAPSNYKAPALEDFGFVPARIIAPDFELKYVKDYDKHRDYPSKEHTTQIGHHLRFGTVSVRAVVEYGKKRNQTFLSEIVWRDFFSQILWHFPKVVTENFRAKYNGIQWRNNKEEFKKWCEGKTGYPLVDAGMRQLNATGFMHNRVRMVTASFLVKHLLIDWRWGEAYFAEKLLDFDLASNNGNWQWAAGTGCDAAPYFRVFNPASQQTRFDKAGEYSRKWVPEIDSFDYPEPMIDHKFARERALATYKEGLEQVKEALN